MKGLSLNLNNPNGSCISYVLLIFGRKIDITCSLSLSIDGILSKCLITTFQEATPLGKKLFMYLDVVYLVVTEGI